MATRTKAINAADTLIQPAPVTITDISVLFVTDTLGFAGFFHTDGALLAFFGLARRDFWLFWVFALINTETFLVDVWEVEGTAADRSFSILIANAHDSLGSLDLSEIVSEVRCVAVIGNFADSWSRDAGFWIRTDDISVDAFAGEVITVSGDEALMEF